MAQKKYKGFLNDFFNSGDVDRCRYCGSIYRASLNDADHAADCPLNPNGYNQPEGSEILINRINSSDKPDEETDQPG